MSAYLRPQDLSQALAVLAEADRRVLAGGTDLFPATDRQMLEGPILDIGGIAALRGIAQTADGLRIGACTTWAEVVRYPGPPGWSAMAEAAREVGGRQIQTSGTVGGNLCNASPAADGVPPLLALEASVELVSTAGRRRMLLSNFLTGPRRTALRPGELMVAIDLPKAALASKSRFLKLGARRHLVISIAMVAVRLRVSEGAVREAALAVGACGPVAVRLPQVEVALIGAPVAEAAGRIEESAVSRGLTPIGDVRATAEYRSGAAAELLRRAVREVLA